MKLFFIYIGGTHEKALIELHDVRLVLAEKIEDTFDYLRDNWWGTPESLHLDAWGELTYADGHKIILSKDPLPETQTKKLYFVNLGGYSETEFTELHKNIFVVAENDSKAKVRALKTILGWNSHHRDYQHEIEKILEVQKLTNCDQYNIHLIPTKEEEEFKFTCKYLPIGKI